jgi:hypothetical protein
MEKKLEVGVHVVYITPDRVKVDALVEVVHTVFSKEESEKHLRGEVAKLLTAEEHKAIYGTWPCINVLYIEPDPSKTDQHGRQKGRASSVCHGSAQGTPQGYCWLWSDEV